MTPESDTVPAAATGSSSAFSPKDTENMAKYGITRVPVDYFHYGDFRYTNLKDAVAQAKLQRHPE